MLTILRRPFLSAPQVAAALGMLQVLHLLAGPRRARRAERLDSLSDHMLRDIGLERGAPLPPRPIATRRRED